LLPHVTGIGGTVIWDRVRR